MDFPKRKRKYSSGSKGPGGFLSVSETFILVVFILLFVSLLLNFFLARRVGSHQKIVVVQKPPLTREAASPPPLAPFLNNVEEPNATSGVSGHWYGLCRRNVVHSVEDFHRIVNSDPLLAKHFVDFNWKNARMGHLPDTIWRRVTYRKDGVIGLTRRAIRLPKGDVYITDGYRWVRTYCCNDYILNGTASDPYLLLRHMRNEARTVTPEPTTFLLVAMGIAGFGLVGLVRKRR